MSLGTVLLEETDPNVIYDMKNTLDGFRVYQTSEVEKFADIFYSKEEQTAGDLGKLQGQLRPAVDRFLALEVEKQDVFKSTLAMFSRVYTYIISRLMLNFVVMLWGCSFYYYNQSNDCKYRECCNEQSC